eukprot:SAG22_NODE_488_length_9853_cov_2.555054_6_plen_437_part_00
MRSDRSRTRSHWLTTTGSSLRRPGAGGRRGRGRRGSAGARNSSAAASKKGVFDRLSKPTERKEKEEVDATFQPEISKRAQRKGKRGGQEGKGDVFSRLNQSAKAQQMKKQGREEEEEKRNAVTKPKLNRSSGSHSKIVSGSVEEDVGSRLHREAEEKMEKLKRLQEAAQRQKIADEDELRRHKLQLTGFAAQHRSVDQLHAWQQDKEQKMEEKKQQLEEEAKAMANPKRYMSEGTRRLVAQLDRSMPVHEMLIAQGKLSDQRQKYLRHLKEEQERISVEMGPSITEAAEQLDRGGGDGRDICERLYEMGLEKKAAQRALEERNPKAVFDPQTGQRLFAPAINPMSWQVQREERIEDVLARKGEEYQQWRAERVEQSEAEHKLSEMQSKMGPYSQLLVQMMETRKGESTEQVNLAAAARAAAAASAAPAAPANRTNP